MLSGQLASNDGITSKDVIRGARVAAEPCDGGRRCEQVALSARRYRLSRCLNESYDAPALPLPVEVSFDYAVNKLFIKETTRP